MRGGEKCLEVACRLFPDATVFTLLRKPGATSAAIERMRIRTSYLQALPGVTRYYRYCLPLMPHAVKSWRVDSDVDVVISFSHAVAKSIRVPAGVPHICYCFTPMRYAWQLRDHYFESSDGEPRKPRKLVKLAMSGARDRVLDRIREWDRATAAGVSQFVAISNTIRDRIRECYDRDSEVIYPPVDTEFYVPSDRPREDYYLCVSALTPYKRIDLAVNACRRLGRRLIVIGAGPERRRLQELGGADVEFRGWCTNEQIREHLQACRALLFPGLEDFGIVPLEAQACGTPVIAFAGGGATETVIAADSHRPGTGVLFPDQTVESMVSGIEQFERADAAVCSSRCRAQAAGFGVARFEAELLSSLHSAAL